MEEKNLENDVPTIELYKVENIMVHASRIVRNCVIGIVAGFMAIVLIVWIFTSKYNERNQNWLEVYNRLLESRGTVTEVQNEHTGNMEQPASP